MNNWIKLLNRQSSVAFQMEVAIANRDELPKAIGCGINNFWSESITNGVFYKQQDLKDLAEAIKKKIRSDPDFVRKNIDECYRLADQLLKAAAGRDICIFRRAYIAFLPYLVYPHSIERYLVQTITDMAKETSDILLTPTISESEEQFDLLKTAQRPTKKAIKKLRNKYCWQPLFSLTAKPLSYSYFADAVTAISDSKSNPSDQIIMLKQEEKEKKKRLRKTLDDIKASPLLRSYVDLLQNYMYLRTYRKNIIAKAHYLHLPILERIGKQMGIGEGIKFLSYEEIISFQESKKLVPEPVIAKRREVWAVLAVDGKISIIAGKNAVLNTARELGIEDTQQVVAQKIVHGQPACKGNTIGPAKIVIGTSDFKKIKSGDILVTPMTTPDYIPVLHKVAGIVTDEGGVTCHAAIVSREFNIPCVVGTGNATKTFKDMDQLKVDADTGEVKLL